VITWLPEWISAILAYLGLVTAAGFVIQVVVGIWLTATDQRPSRPDWRDHAAPLWTEDDLS
jgi:hypothetical protein